jgi:hypothetical protein
MALTLLIGSLFPIPLQSLPQLFPLQRVQHIARLQSAAPRHCDAVEQAVESIGRVRVAVNHDGYAHFARATHAHIVKVKTFGRTINF